MYRCGHLNEKTVHLHEKTVDVQDVVLLGERL